ncbi:putative transposase [Citreicella sp. 357]|nr:putative transposase [Citreicella sp. 357]
MTCPPPVTAVARHHGVVAGQLGGQFTPTDFIKVLAARKIRISMDGKGAWRDNVFVERLWRSMKYEEVYLRAYVSVSEARAGIGRMLSKSHSVRSATHRLDLSGSGIRLANIWPTLEHRASTDVKPDKSRFFTVQSALSRGAQAKHLVNLARGGHFIATADRGDFAGQAFQRGFVKLTLGIGLFALVVGAVQIAHHLGDGDQVARVDLLLVFLGAARPHRPLYLGLAPQRLHRLADHIGGRQGTHADFGRLVRGHTQGHLVLFKGDHKKFQLDAGDFLLFDRHDLTDAMRGVDDIVVGAKIVFLGLGHTTGSLAAKPFCSKKGPIKDDTNRRKCNMHSVRLFTKRRRINPPGANMPGIWCVASSCGGIVPQKR